MREILKAGLVLLAEVREHARRLPEVSGAVRRAWAPMPAAMLDGARRAAGLTRPHLSALAGRLEVVHGHVSRLCHRIGTGRLQQILIAALFCTLVASGYGIVGSAAHRFMRAQAELTARDWGSFLAAKVPDLAAIAEGTAPRGETLRLLQDADLAGRVVRVRFIDLEGRVRYATNGPGYPLQPAYTGHVLLPPAVVGPILEGRIVTESRRARDLGDPPFSALATLPIRGEGRVRGIMQVEVDQTREYRLFFSVLAQVAASFGLILAAAFGIPAIGFWWRTRQKELAEHQLRFLAHHDPLTALSNRTAFLRDLETIMPGLGGGAPRLAIHFLDLDHFKEVNDTYGHDVGDALLKEAARRLTESLGPEHHVARLGGDEFVVLQRGIAEVEDARLLAERLVGVFDRAFPIQGHLLRVKPSIGIALAPVDATSPERLVKCADLALYAVKSSGRGSFRFYDATLDQQMRRRRQLEQQVREACMLRTFELRFQPVYDLQKGGLLGFESLLRLQPPDGESAVSPAEFIPIAEETGLIHEIGEWVLVETCRAAAEWPDPLKVAVNMSPAQFRERDVVELVANALKVSGLPPQRLEIEVTEGVFLKDSAAVRAQMRALKALGVSIVLDDFGTGYSSLGYLWQFPVDKIKIDQSFIRALGESDNVPDILRTIIALGRALNLRVTAEGVETEEQAAVLRGMRCDQVQGYLYGRPMPLADVSAIVLAEFAAHLASPRSVVRQAEGAQPA